MGERLFKSKSHNILATVFSAVYILSLVFDSGLSMVYFENFNTASLRYLINTLFILALNAAAPLVLVLAALTSGKSRIIRKYIVPAGFGIRALTALGLAFSSGELALLGSKNAIGIVLYILVCLQGLAVILMFIGTLFDLEYPALLKWGSIVFIAASAATDFTQFVVLGYRSFVVLGYWRMITAEKLFGIIALILFHVAILLISQKPKEE